ncbi:carbohydrate-binding domain-containing protein [Aminipila sp.]|uniref:carbohydrate-binding domain-containing protein n=1 Tax=Aminipila sp. TaxID=2060095 RepID=UPI00289FBFAB|nr:carbohydrate-binding domain-containing protein [Aminipila sp.]
MKKEMLKESKKRIITGALAGAMVISGFGISAFTADAADIADAKEKIVLYTNDIQLSAIAAKATSTSSYTDYKTQEYQKVTLKGSSISFEGKGATVSGSDLLITAAGMYVISGTLNDGAIIIDSAAAENVTLVLENANIICKDGAPIYVKNCGKNVIISVPEGTTNTITDGSNYTYEYKTETTDTETNKTSVVPSAAIYSKDDLKINGSGKLTVNANYKDGITGKDDVEIAETTLLINAADDGIVGKDSVVIGSGNITVKAKGDGIKATNSEDTAKGYIAIADGTFNITSGNDGIQAESILLTLGGDYTIKTGDGSAAAKSKQDNRQGQMPGQGGQQMQRPENTSKSALTPGSVSAVTGATKKVEKSTAAAITKTATTTTKTETESESAKALKAGAKVVIQDGNFNIDSEDDAVHSNDSVAVASGKFEISAGDDGIHADNKLEIYCGDIDIAKSYEGLESTEMTIDGGTIDIVASDDGINVSGGNENLGFGSGTIVNNSSSGTSTTTDSNTKLTIKDGKINVNASGDGIDINGSGYMTGGTVAVSGPTNNGNAGLDYDGVFEVTGGTLIVAGSSGMAQAPSSGTTVNTVATTVTTQAIGTEVQLVNSSGTTVMSFTPEKEFSHIVISSSVIEKGETYKIMAGKTELASFTADSTVTNLSGNSMHGGMAPPDGSGSMQAPPNNSGTRPERTNMQNNVSQ